jgi:hypothetical protein
LIFYFDNFTFSHFLIFYYLVVLLFDFYFVTCWYFSFVYLFVFFFWFFNY